MNTPIPNANLLPPDALKSLSRWHEKMAGHFLDLAKDAQRRIDAQDRMNELRRKARASADMVATYIENGQSPEQAIETTHRLTGADVDAIRVLLPRARAKADKLRLMARNREIMGLWRQGLGNTEIGRKFGLHPKHVARIITQEKNTYY